MWSLGEKSWVCLCHELGLEIPLCTMNYQEHVIVSMHFNSYCFYVLWKYQVPYDAWNWGFCWKITFLQNSGLSQLAGQARTRHGELGSEAHSSSSPWRVWQHNMCCRLVLWPARAIWGPFLQSFIKLWTPSILSV